MSAEQSWIELHVPLLGDAEAANLRKCLETNWVSSCGPFVCELEARFAERLAGC